VEQLIHFCCELSILVNGCELFFTPFSLSKFEALRYSLLFSISCLKHVVFSYLTERNHYFSVSVVSVFHLSCIAKSTSVFQNFIISLLMLTCSLNLKVLSCMLLSLACYQSLYAIMLLVPLAMVLESHKWPTRNGGSQLSLNYSVTIILLSVILSVASFFHPYFRFV